MQLSLTVVCFINENMLSDTTLYCCVITQSSCTIVRHFFYNNLKTGTFEHAVVLLARSHYMCLFIKIVNMLHICGLKYPNFDVNKNKI